MKKLYYSFLLLICAQGFSQVGINNSAPKAMLDITASSVATPANTDGILIPRISAFPATNPAAAQNGMLVFLTTTASGKSPGFYYWNQPTTAWVGFGGVSSTGWLLTGNAGTSAANFLGTTDNVNLSFKRNNVKRETNFKIQIRP